jgi:hypothetical protein
MRYFHRLAENIPAVLPIMHAVMRQPELWNTDKTRTGIPNGPHGQASDIILRFGERDLGSLQAWDREAMKCVPGAKTLALDIMRIVGGSQLGRVMITKLEPGKKIAAHADEGAYAKFYNRYHVILQGMPGSLFTCGDETVNMLTGECWWVDRRVVHSLANNSKDDRVHMIVDARVDG